MAQLPADCGKFRIQALLGEGGYGAVYRATHEELGREVALKVLSASGIDDPEQVERFLTEARVTARLSSPHIVRVLDQGAGAGVPWIAYELLEGRSVRRMLADGPLEPGQALQIAAQVAAALEEAHAHGVIHRDIKPDNVLEHSPGRHVVADFGIARWVEGSRVHTATGVILGTPAYIAPELVEGEPAAEGADLYALGIMLYELLTGRVPFDDESYAVVLQRHLKATPPPPSARRAGLAPAIDELVLRALAKKPAERHGSAAAFRTAARRLLDPAAAHAPLPVERPRRSTPRKTRAATDVEAPQKAGRSSVRAGAALGAAALLAVGALVLFRAGRGVPPAPPTPTAARASPVDTVTEEETWLAARRPDEIADVRYRLARLETLARPIQAPSWVAEKLYADLAASTRSLDDAVRTRISTQSFFEQGTETQKRRTALVESLRSDAAAAGALTKQTEHALAVCAALGPALLAIDISPQFDYDAGCYLAAAVDTALLLEMKPSSELDAMARRWASGRPPTVTRHVFEAVRAQRAGKHRDRIAPLRRALALARVRVEKDPGLVPSLERVAYLHAQLSDALKQAGAQPKECHELHAEWLAWKGAHPAESDIIRDQVLQIGKNCRGCPLRR